MLRARLWVRASEKSTYFRLRFRIRIQVSHADNSNKDMEKCLHAFCIRYQLTMMIIDLLDIMAFRWKLFEFVVSMIQAIQIETT